MRRVNPSRFKVATRSTSREINRSIVLNLVRARQPISRADLARVMDVRRGAVTLIVNDLLREGLIFEGATGETVRGRKPTFLYIDSRRRAVLCPGDYVTAARTDNPDILPFIGDQRLDHGAIYTLTFFIAKEPTVGTKKVAK